MDDTIENVLAFSKTDETFQNISTIDVDYEYRPYKNHGKIICFISNDYSIKDTRADFSEHNKIKPYRNQNTSSGSNEEMLKFLIEIKELKKRLSDVQTKIEQKDDEYNSKSSKIKHLEQVFKRNQEKIKDCESIIETHQSKIIKFEGMVSELEKISNISSLKLDRVSALTDRVSSDLNLRGDVLKETSSAKNSPRTSKNAGRLIIRNK